MINRGTKLFYLLMLTMLLVGALASPLASADSWITKQADSQSVSDVTSIAWNNQQSDSHSVPGVLLLTWYDQQSDSSSVNDVLSASAAWRIQQSDSTQMQMYPPSWHGQQNDSESTSLQNPAFRSQQGDIHTFQSPDAVWFELQDDLSPDIEIKEVVIPPFINSFGSFGAMFIAILFLAIMFTGLVAAVMGR